MKIKVPKIELPKGYKIVLRKGDFSYAKEIELRYKFPNNKYYFVGKVELVRDYHRNNVETYRTHSFLDEKFRGIGLGDLLYAKAIAWCLQHNYKVKSSGASSVSAKRVWEGKGLKRYFTIKKINRSTWEAFINKRKLNNV